MKELLEKQLVEKYPLIFSQRCDISCGDGWYQLIDTLCGIIQGHIHSVERQRTWALTKNMTIRPDDTDPYDVPEPVVQVIAQQIKEKFGTLRFYTTGGDSYIHGAIQMADTMSEHICEECGNVGKRRPGSWIRTLCDQHFVANALGATDEFLS
jgi:hypothetical protein